MGHDWAAAREPTDQPQLSEHPDQPTRPVATERQDPRRTSDARREESTAKVMVVQTVCGKVTLPRLDGAGTLEATLVGVQTARESPQTPSLIWPVRLCEQRSCPSLTTQPGCPR